MEELVKYVIERPTKHYHEVILQKGEVVGFLEELVKYENLYHGSLKITYLQLNQEYMLTFETSGL